MYLDKTLTFAENVALPLSTVTQTQLGTTVAMHGGAPNATVDYGVGEPMYLVITCQVKPVSAGSASQKFTLTTTDSVTSNIVLETTVLFSEFAVGKTLRILPLPAGADYRKSMLMYTTASAADTTAGKVSAFLVKDPSAWRAYKAVTGV